MSQPLGKNMTVTVEAAANAARKTSTWVIRSNDGGLLGRVRWFTAWRRYVLEPEPVTVFDVECLSLIAAFLVEQTDKQKALSAERRANTSARNR